MKTKILSFVSAVAISLGFSACHDPYEFTPTDYDEQFNSIMAWFLDDDRKENNFPGEFDFENHTITIVVPYTYPPKSDSHLEMSDLTSMKVRCNLKTGLRIEPALNFMDLSKENTVYIIDQNGKRTPFTVTAEIRKSSECDILDFVVADVDITGVINTSNKTVTLLATEDVGTHLANLEISHGATIDPDPRKTPINFDQELTLTVTAQNGVDKAEYRVIKGVPDKMPFGLRRGSAKMAWVLKQADFGVKTYSSAELSGGDLRFNGSAGIAVVGDNLVLNEAGMGKAYVFKYKNGEFVKTIDLTSLGTNSLGQYNNHRMTSDHFGNILICTSANFNGGVISLYRMKGVDGDLELLATHTAASAVGNTLSITGNVDEDAIITTSNNGATGFYRWEVKNGVFKPAEFIKPTGYAANVWGTFDAVYLEPTLPSEYIAIGYVGFTTNPPTANGTINRTCAWLTNDNTIKCYGDKCITSNSPENAGDLIEFNGCKYYVHNIVNTLGYGHGASMVMYNLAGRNLSIEEVDFSNSDNNTNGIKFQAQYGAEAASQTNGKAGNGNDVHFFASPDGYFLYLFFEYTNGYLGAIRFDCLKIN